MFIVNCTIPIGPRVALLAVFTHSDFFTMSTLSEILAKSWYEMQEHVAPVSNRAIIGSQSWLFTVKIGSF